MSNQESIQPFSPEYLEMTAQNQDAILFWRLGDFYEVFHDDAVVVAGCLNTTLLTRQGVPITGLPWHSVSAALAKMVKAGYKVAVCEPVKGRKKYEAVRVVSPGLDRAREEAAPPLPKEEDPINSLRTRMQKFEKKSRADMQKFKEKSRADMQGLKETARKPYEEQTGQKWRPALRVIEGGGNTTPITRIVTLHNKPLP